MKNQLKENNLTKFDNFGKRRKSKKSINSLNLSNKNIKEQKTAENQLVINKVLKKKIINQ